MFVSSTCYDLAQLRADIRDFAESVGLEPILSELDTFNVNPSRATVENCLEAVRSRTDIFLLVVGGRYGSINHTGKSITNLEYLEAAALGIPKYVFVKAEILSLLPIWRVNHDVDFSSAVDTSQLFEFISQLMVAGEEWIFPFNDAQDITNTLRKQLSYLFADCLSLRAKMQTVDFTTLKLGPESLRIFIEKPGSWEYLVFAKVLQEQIRLQESKRLDAELGISFGPLILLADSGSAMDWISEKFAQLGKAPKQMSLIIDSGFEKAVGKPGEPGDIKRIVHLASRIIDGYAQVLDWKLEFSRLTVEPELERLIQLTSSFSTTILRDIEIFSEGLYERVQHAVANHSSGEVVNFTLTFTSPNVKEFEQELLRLTRLLA